MSRVLLVEDDPAVAAAHVKLLRLEGHDVATAGTVDAALLELASTEPDVVLLDLHLDRDSAQVQDALYRRGLPVIVVSGADAASIESIAASKGWRFMAKPFSGVAMRAEMARSLADARERDEPSAASPGGKSTVQVVAETLVDLFALGIMGALLLLRRVQAEWLQALLVVGMLLLAGVRVADLRAFVRGMPTQGGVAAVAFAFLGNLVRIGERL